MEAYLINLSIVTIFSMCYEVASRKQYREKIMKYIFLIAATASLIVVSGFRNGVGTDYQTYSEIYKFNGPEPFNLFESEIGFDLLYKSLYKISSNPQFFFFVTSIIINLGIVYFLKKYSNKFSLSMYFYITTFVYYGTMNGLRQYLASVCLITGYKHIISGNFKKYILFIAVASLFHSSALIMIPIFFIVRKDTYSLTNFIVGGLFILAFVFYQPFLNIIFKIFGESKYSHYENILQDTSNGANIIRVAVWMLPVIIILLYRKRAKRIYGKELNILLNLCIIGMLFMALAYRHVFFARFCMYFDIYYLLLLPKICKMFDRQSNAFFTTSMVVGYLLYSTLLLLNGESWIYPYKYNLNLF